MMMMMRTCCHWCGAHRPHPPRRAMLLLLLRNKHRRIIRIRRARLSNTTTTEAATALPTSPHRWRRIDLRAEVLWTADAIVHFWMIHCRAGAVQLVRDRDRALYTPQPHIRHDNKQEQLVGHVTYAMQCLPHYLLPYLWKLLYLTHCRLPVRTSASCVLLQQKGSAC